MCMRLMAGHRMSGKQLPAIAASRSSRMQPMAIPAGTISAGPCIWRRHKQGRAIFSRSDSLDNEGHQTYVELRKLASDIIIWRTTLAVSGHLSLAWLTRNR